MEFDWGICVDEVTLAGVCGRRNRSLLTTWKLLVPDTIAFAKSDDERVLHDYLHATVPKSRDIIRVVITTLCSLSP